MNIPLHQSAMPRYWRYLLAFCLLWGLLAVHQGAFAQTRANATNCPACAQIKARLDEALRMNNLIREESNQATERAETLERQNAEDGQGPPANLRRAQLDRSYELASTLRLRGFEQWEMISALRRQWADCVARHCPNLNAWSDGPLPQSTCKQCEPQALDLFNAELTVFLTRQEIASAEADIENDFLPKLMADKMTGDDQQRLNSARDRVARLTRELESELDAVSLARVELAACNRRYCVEIPPARDLEAVCPACQPILGQINRLATDLVAAREHWYAMRRELDIYNDIEVAKRTAAQRADSEQIVRELNAVSARFTQDQRRILTLTRELDSCVREHCRPRTGPPVVIEQVIPRIGNAPFTSMTPGPAAVAPLPPQTPATPTPPVSPPITPPITPPVTPPVTPPAPATGCSSNFSSGNYICSGSCGIGSVNLTVTPGSSTMTANTLGANTGVVFSCTGPTASSQSSNLIILGAPGHRCNQTASGLTSFGESCSNAGGGSCFSTCSR